MADQDANIEKKTLQERLKAIATDVEAAQQLLQLLKDGLPHQVSTPSTPSVEIKDPATLSPVEELLLHLGQTLFNISVNASLENEAAVPHEFVSLKAVKPRSCDYCGNMMFGIGSKPVQCTKCTLQVHHKCVPHVTDASCRNEPCKVLYPLKHAAPGSTQSSTRSRWSTAGEVGNFTNTLDLKDSFLLQLEIKQAYDLPKKDRFGTIDAFVVISFGTFTYRTKVVRNTRHPVWNQKVLVMVTPDQKDFSVVFTLYDKDFASSNEYVGYCRLDAVGNLQSSAQEQHQKLTIAAREGGPALGTLDVVARAVSAEQLEQFFWTSLLRVFDSDGNGALDENELTMMLDAVGCDVAPEELHELFVRADTDKNGTVDAQELAVILGSNSSGLNFQNFRTQRFIFFRLCLIFLMIIWHISACLCHSDGIDHFVTGGFLTSAYASKGWFGRTIGRVMDGKYSLTNQFGNIIVRNRATGVAEEEAIPGYIRLSLRLIYRTPARPGMVKGGKEEGRMLKFLKFMTSKEGKKMDKPASAKHIASFIKFHKIDMDLFEVPEGGYQTFNEFFYRKLKPGVRPVSGDDNTAVCPADCRLNVFEQITLATEHWIKGSEFTLENVVKDRELASQFANGSLAIARLAPQDYHRYHMPVHGLVKKIYPVIAGEYMTVNPMAVRQNVQVFTENIRQVIVVESPEFGTVVYVCVGATLVGSIQLTIQEGQEIHRGDEVGYFAFGGSTILIFFQANRIQFAQDLISNSLMGMETLVQMGTPLGKAGVLSSAV